MSQEEYHDGVSVSVFIVDDHELVRRGVVDFLRAQEGVEVVGEAGTAEEALSRVGDARPDVVLLDVRLPDGSGIEVCREIRSRHPSVHCVVFTSYPDEESLFSAIMAGASGYLLKSIKADELLEALRKVAAGQSLLDPSVTGQVLDRIRGMQEADTRVAALTEQERRILDLIGEGLSNREIAERVHLAEKTVKNYVSSLLDKLGMERRTQAAVFADRLTERRSHTA